jgi:hypothetical protein
MDNTKPTTALEMFDDWSPRFLTHHQRFAVIVTKHSKNIVQFVDALRMYSAESFESKVIIDTLLDELVNISNEAKETVESLRDDNEELRKIFKSFQQETKKETDDTP